MLNVSVKTNYGILLLVDLSKKEGTTVSLREVSLGRGISQKFLWQLANSLRAAGLVKVSRGARGGYSLARNPDHISLLDIVLALGGKERISGVSEDVNEASQVLTYVWSSLDSKVRELLAAVSLAQIRDKELEIRSSQVLSWVI